MISQDCQTARERLDAALDGELPTLDHGALQRHLESCAPCQAAARDMQTLHDLLTADREVLPADFTARVLAALPPAAWEVRGRAGRWVALAVAASVALFVGSLALLGGVLPGLGAASTLVDFGLDSLAAAAGLAGASWRGLRHAVLELRQVSPGTLAALAVLTLGLQAAAWRLARRRQHGAAPDRQDSRS